MSPSRHPLPVRVTQIVTATTAAVVPVVRLRKRAVAMAQVRGQDGGMHGMRRRTVLVRDGGTLVAWRGIKRGGDWDGGAARHAGGRNGCCGCCLCWFVDHVLVLLSVGFCYEKLAVAGRW